MRHRLRQPAWPSASHDRQSILWTFPEKLRLPRYALVLRRCKSSPPELMARKCGNSGTFVPFSSTLGGLRFPLEQHLGEGCSGERPVTL